MNRVVLCVVLVLVLGTFIDVSTGNQRTGELAVKKPTPLGIVVELAVFYDTEFAGMFKFNRTSILEYLGAVLYDTHLRLVTLPHFNISLKVTSLKLVKDFDNDVCTPNPSSLDDVDDLQNKLAYYAYSQMNKLPQFDVTVLALGTNVPFTEVREDTSKSSFCQGDQSTENGKWHNNIVITMKSHPSEDLAINILHLLGLPKPLNHFIKTDLCDPEADKSSPQNCKVASTKSVGMKEPLHFTKLADAALKNRFLQLFNIPEALACMNASNSVQTPILDTAKLVGNPNDVRAYTIQQQCRLLTRDANAKIKIGGCHSINCTFSQGEISFVPLEGSVCGKSGTGRCMRSTCIQRTIQLVNVGTGKCLASESSMFSSYDHPVLRDCSSSLFDVIVPIDAGNEFAVGMMYHDNENWSMSLKMLLVVQTEDDTITALFAPGTDGVHATPWIKEKVKGSKDELVLRSSTENACLKADDSNNGVVSIVSNCSPTDAMSRWKFVSYDEGESPVSQAARKFAKSLVS